MDNLEAQGIKILHENVWVFSKWVKNPQEIIEFYLENPEFAPRWVPWYTYGEMIDGSGVSWGQSDDFPTATEWEDCFKDAESPKKYIADLFYKASKLYIDSTGIELNNWHAPNWSIAKYFPDVPDFEIPSNRGLTMIYHSDYQQELVDYPGLKSRITAVVYPNDDYEGGAIHFRITDENDSSKVLKEIHYKPEAGDILMFPSRAPYYHGVTNIKENPKYIFRLYWQQYEEASPIYNAMKEKYGDLFDEVDLPRKRRYDMTIPCPVLRPRMSMEEYYENLHAGTLKDDYREGEADPCLES